MNNSPLFDDALNKALESLPSESTFRSNADNLITDMAALYAQSSDYVHGYDTDLLKRVAGMAITIACYVRYASIDNANPMKMLDDACDDKISLALKNEVRMSLAQLSSVQKIANDDIADLRAAYQWSLHPDFNGFGCPGALQPLTKHLPRYIAWIVRALAKAESV